MDDKASRVIANVESVSLNGADDAMEIELASLNGANSVATELELPSLNEADSVAIPIEGLASSIEEDMASNDPFMSPNCCIFKTPNILYRLNEKAYVPDAFSIGPFHHGQPNFSDTEQIKMKYLQGLISRPSPETTYEDLFNSVQEVCREARECYSKPIDCSSGEFVKILVIDGCFIIELFRKSVYGDLMEDNDPIFSVARWRLFLVHDLILLENQVPWMVLERLFNKTKNEVHMMPLIDLAIKFFTTTFSFTKPPPINQNLIKDIKHIPDLISKWMVLSAKKVEKSPGLVSFRGENGWQPMPCVTSLVEAGIKFRRVESKSILDINFNEIDGVLEIPSLLIQETTETVFRNIISFEQCYPNCEGRFTSYAVLMDSLINSAKDVDILGNNEILDNWLSPEYAAQLFKNLHHNTCYDEYYYQSLSRDVSRYCQRCWPRWRVALMRNYFYTPWVIFSILAAVVILILTLLQTVYSMKKQ